MKRWVWLLVPAVTACTIDELSTTQVEQNAGDYQAGDYQSGDYQAGDYQSGDYQSGDYQGAHYESSTFAGATLNGGAVSEVHVYGTTLVVWKKVKALAYPYYAWEERRPNKICKWNADRTTSACTSVDPSVTASPLAGVRFPTTLRTATGTMAGWVQIGSSASALNAVRHDPSYAMHPLEGFGPGTPQHPYSCTHPDGCRKNSDLWVYDVRLVNSDGSLLQFCSSNQSYALAGTWGATGQFATSETQFTFACSTGTIAKCTRWGYRPWVTTATRADGATDISLAPYHQACVRAAMADYCANGHSFTKSHTLVDLHDWDPSSSSNYSFIPAIPAFPEESAFDVFGAESIDHYRYQEMAGTQAYGSIEDPTLGCPTRFTYYGGSDDVPPTYLRQEPPGTGPYIYVDSGPACAHSPLTVGKWLHEKCFGGACPSIVEYSSDEQGSLGYCTDPTSPAGWDARCVAKAQSKPTCNAGHGECTTGTPLGRWATQCTATVCMDERYKSCCDATSGTGAWSSTCTAAANAMCTGGREHVDRLTMRSYGFCNQIIQPVNSL